MNDMQTPGGGKCQTTFQPLTDEAKAMFNQTMMDAFHQTTFYRCLEACKGPPKKPMRPPRPARRGR